ncbi:MAG: cytochrome d ubiquinol oxidase subunit II [Gammaproteobacteria bacterium]|nr:cytochrome d ubiquinol oxidase subunit II [Gammaproteobacteria bacterium]
MEGGWLPLVWLFLIALAIFMYVLLDGFVLGIGILFPFAPKDADRDTMMLSVAPIWDGNETWLVLGTGGLLAMFPVAYAIVLPALYLPFIFMLFGLIFRGISFEFRFKADRSRRIWDRAFLWGSVAAAFFQGIVLGSFVQGFDLAGSSFTGGPLDWLTPFGLLVGAALVLGYALLGSTWLIIKAPGELETWARRVSVRLLLAVLAAIAAISLWVVFTNPTIRQRWFSLPNFYFLSQVPLATVVTGFLHWYTTVRGFRVAPFVLTMVLFTLGYVGLAISLWPNIVPHEIPYWEAAASPSTQRFLLVGALITLPAVLFYTFYAYYVFRGKVARDLTY